MPVFRRISPRDFGWKLRAIINPISQGARWNARHPPAFLKSPPEGWEPKLGDRVQLFYGGKVHEVVVTKILENQGFVVAGDSLLLLVACGLDSLRPLDDP